MGALSIPEDQLIPAEKPRTEPRILSQTREPRKVNNLTLIDGKTFISTTVSGDIAPAGAPDVGFFCADTRFLSHLELRISGHRAVVLSSSTEKAFASQIELTAGHMTLRDSFDVAENTVHIRREQVLGSDTLFDRFTFENFNLRAVELEIELEIDADFVDVFQVRGVPREVHGQYYKPVVRDNTVSFVYRGLDGITRETHVELSPTPDAIDGYNAHWHVRLEPLKRVHIQVVASPRIFGHETRADSRDPATVLRRRRHAYNMWESTCSHFRSSNEVFNTALATCVSDFHALLIPNADEHIIAAGIPWFATIFGRDSIIAAYQSLLLNPQLAIDTLRVLARYQGKERNDWRDEDPGKIIHESREGEMTLCSEIPFGTYYGSVDSTPLFLILLSECWNWTADEALVKELLPNAYRALEWIEKYGDIDKDGFVEYQRRSARGLANQGWKDSWDANMHRDGSVAESPIALVEVQGYVYDAKYRMASLLRNFGDSATADRLKKEASELAKRFEKAYWMPQRNYYAMGLDASKKQIQVISSNAGQLLFTRMIGKERMRAVIDRLMSGDMFSGWGWRTVSDDEPVFNPLSYHRGSVWPHDNSLIAHGMALNEFRRPAMHGLSTLFHAALNFRDYRLPELFCGVQRREHDVPVQYPVSCSPQAWASGAMFLMLTSVLGLRPSAPRKELNIINPQLPEWLDHFHIRNLRVGNSRVGLDFTRRGERTFCNVVDITGDKLFVNVVFKGPTEKSNNRS